jgi:hypothetical protein
MGFCSLHIQGARSVYTSSQLFSNIVISRYLKLPDPMASNFTPEILCKAMLETISYLNVMAEDEGITEVRTN